jgi:hypothetical protein
VEVTSRKTASPRERSLHGAEDEVDPTDIVDEYVRSKFGAVDRWRRGREQTRNLGAVLECWRCDANDNALTTAGGAGGSDESFNAESGGIRTSRPNLGGDSALPYCATSTRFDPSHYRPTWHEAAMTWRAAAEANLNSANNNSANNNKGESNP